MILYAIKIGYDWYTSHGGRSGSGCLQTTTSVFPLTTYSMPEDAKFVARSLLRDFPVGCREIPDGRYVQVVEITYTIKKYKA